MIFSSMLAEKTLEKRTGELQSQIKMIIHQMDGVLKKLSDLLSAEYICPVCGNYIKVGKRICKWCKADFS